MTPPAKRRGSKAEILMFELVEEVEKACLAPTAGPPTVQGTPVLGAGSKEERAVSPAKFESAVRPSPVKVVALDRDAEMADLKQRMTKMEETMAMLMAQNTQLMAQNAQLLQMMRKSE